MTKLTEEKIIAAFAHTAKASSGDVGIGDDCAVLTVDPEKQLVLTTDSLVENVHFKHEWSSPYDIGHKLCHVNLSDLAAMGARPKACLLSLHLPVHTSLEWIEEFRRGFLESSNRVGLSLIGGNTTRSAEMILALTALGEISKENIKLRRSAEVGDLIFVTRPLGDSSAGLDALLKGRNGKVDSLVRAHLRPEAETEVGPWLAKKSSVHALMDLSDGLSTDLPRLLKASQCGAEIDASKIPCTDVLKSYCKEYKVDRFDFCLNGGEDYALLGTAKEKDFEEIRLEFESSFKRPLSVIGQIKKGLSLTVMGAPQKTARAFSHF